MNKEVSYHSHGKVLGKYWEGGSGSYNTTVFTANSLEELLVLNNNALNDGSLDSGMGYKSLIGAILIITITTKIVFENEDYFNTKEDIEFIGELNDEQTEFLEQSIYE